ncbi:MAG TPA: hypothetical protein VK928_03090 [Longimicrobiales bacterium]|nr:hypothetical protein [Longimicrobiales bacterium]
MRITAILALALLGACSSSTDPLDDGGVPGPDGLVRVMGEIKGYNQGDPHIRIDASGRDVTVRVTSYGGGCHRKGDTVVKVDGLVADITPYDRTAPPGTMCTQPLLSFEHVATVRFDRTGGARIRVHGIDASARHAGNMRGEEIVVEQVVPVW